MSQSQVTRSTRQYVTRTSCGFCEGGHGQPRGVCQDVDGRCEGHLAGFRQGHCRQS